MAMSEGGEGQRRQGRIITGHLKEIGSGYAAFALSTATNLGQVWTYSSINRACSDAKVS